MAGAVFFKAPGLLALLTPIFVVPLLAEPPRICVAGRFVLPYWVALALTALPVAIFLATTHQHRQKSVLGENFLAVISQMASNIHTLYQWLWSLWSPPLLMCASTAFIFAALKTDRRHLLLTAVSLIPMFSFAAVSKIWCPRYVLFATVPALALVAGTVTDLTFQMSRWVRFMQLPVVRGLVAALFVVFVGLFVGKPDWLVLTNPALARLPDIERAQYIEDWPSGYGVLEAADYLRTILKNNDKAVVFVHNGCADSVLRTYLMNGEANHL
jgi:hypothetical protein